MSSLIILKPPQAVPGHPIDIMEIQGDSRQFLWTLRLRITTADKVIECVQRYDRQKRITIDTVPESAEAYRLLLASRGADPYNGPNPLAEAVEAAISA